MKLKHSIIGTTIILTILAGCTEENTGSVQSAQTQALSQKNTAAQTLVTQQQTQEELISYTNKDLGMKFSYPKSWGKPTVKHSTFDPDCATQKTAPNIDVMTISIGYLKIEGSTKNTCRSPNAYSFSGYNYVVYKNQKEFEQNIADKKKKGTETIKWETQEIALDYEVPDGVSYEEGAGCQCSINTTLFNPESKYGSISLSMQMKDKEKEKPIFLDLLNSLEFIK